MSGMKSRLLQQVNPLPSQSLRNQWVNECWRLAGRPADLYSGCRKILRNVVLEFTLDDSLTLADAGFTQAKLTALTKHYLHKESQRVAVTLWQKRLAQQKYGSVSFTTFNHFTKGAIDQKRSKRASILGPCLQSVVITWVDQEHHLVDVFYRSTELFKKFAPDLVLIRDVLLPPFKLPKPTSVRMHFANTTSHPMFAITTFPHLANPIDQLKQLRIADKYFHDWTVKWSARYLCKEYAHGIAKFSQALRVQADAKKRIDTARLREIQKYLRDNHPGYTRTRFKEKDDDDSNGLEDSQD